MSGEKVYLPKQEMHEGRGEAGYLDLEGNIEVVDKPDPAEDTYQGDAPNEKPLVEAAKNRAANKKGAAEEPAEGES